ncbi:hypothetical protein ACFLWF_00880 [Chloroflexota bacterium]
MKRRWWLWLILATACFMVTFSISEITGISTGNIIGWGTLGILGKVALVFGLVFGFAIAAGIAYIIAHLLKLLLKKFVSHGEKLSTILGVLGFCIILVGYVLTNVENNWSNWSLFIMIIGFFTGCLAGVVYQESKSLNQ